ncbi:MAG: RNA methyltransferase [Treponemataceae bacterium]|nr:RNA methyltransferase [Treponemataceae bacterium]
MRNKLTGELAVCGVNAVRALASIHPERIQRFFFREDRARLFGETCKYLAQHHRPYKLCDDGELERLCKSPRHQGVVAMIHEPEIPALSDKEITRWIAEGGVGILLDAVGNDNNLGAIVRAAAFFGVKWVVLSSHDKEARLTTSAYRVAEGGMEYVRLCKVPSLAECMRRYGNGVMFVGADHRASINVRGSLDVLKERYPERFRNQKAQPAMAIVVGNEERGLSREVKAACALLVRIPGAETLESLNVAQAAAICMHELCYAT